MQEQERSQFLQWEGEPSVNSINVYRNLFSTIFSNKSGLLVT